MPTANPGFYALCDFEGRPEIVYNGATALCLGETIELTAEGDDDFARVEWSFGPETQTAVFTPLQARTYEISYTAVTLCSERLASETINIEVYPFPETPVVSYDEPNNLLQTQPQELLQWYRGTFAETDTALNAETDEAIQPMYPGNYYVVASSRGGCSDTSEIFTLEDVNYDARPRLSLAGPDTICVGETTRLNAGHGYLSYQWNTGSQAQVYEYQGFTPGDFDFYATVELPGGVLRPTDTLTITVLARPATPDAAYDAETNTLSTGAEGALQWYRFNEDDEARLLPGVTRQNYQPLQNGRYFVEATNANGCSNRSAEVFVTICDFSRDPNIRLAGPVAFCLGGNVLLRADNGFDGYTWSFGGPDAPAATFRPEEAGTFEVFVTVPLACGLSVDSDTLIVEVYELPEEPELSFDALDREITAESDDDLFWYRGGGVPAEDTLLRLDPGARVYEITESGNYYVVARTENGCADTSEVVRAEVCDPDFKPYIEPASALTFCLGESVALDAGAEGVAYEWSNGATTREVMIAPEEAEREDYYVVVEYACGFMVSDTVTVTAEALPERPSVSREPESNTLTAEGDVFLQWYFIDEEGETFVLNGANEAEYKARETGGYFVETRNEAGCSAVSDTLVVDSLVGRAALHGIGELRMFPNPAHDVVSLTGDWQDAGVVVAKCYGADGKLYFEEALPAELRVTLDVSALPAGVYILKIEAGERSAAVRLVKY